MEHICPYMHTLVLPESTLFQFFLDIHFFNENGIKKWSSVSFLAAVFHRFPPYTMTKIRKMQIFVILSGTHLPLYAHPGFAWVYTLSIFPWYTFSQWKWHKKMIISVFSGRWRLYGRVCFSSFSLVYDDQDS